MSRTFQKTEQWPDLAPLFADFCIIRPDGYRCYARDHHTYLELLAGQFYSRSEIKKHPKRYQHWFFERKLECQLELPKHHLAGLKEAYPNPYFAIAIASYEYNRVASYLDGISKGLKPSPGGRFHLCLTLTTSVGIDGQLNTDITKSVFDREKAHCTCQLCIPAEFTYSAHLFDEPPVDFSSIKLDAAAANIFLPFRRYKKLSQPPPFRPLDDDQTLHENVGNHPLVPKS